MIVSAYMYPMLARGELAENTAEAMGFPTIPGAPAPTGLAIGLMDYDFGSELDYNDFSGALAKQPPGIRRTIPPLVPRVDAGDNETAGIPSVLHSAPLGTYTGWNATAKGFFQGQPCGGGLTGGYVPFAKTEAERIASNDPRPSLEERYGTKTGYLCAVRKAATREVGRRFLLAEDAAKLIGLAETADILPTGTGDREAGAVEKRHCGG